MNKVAVIGSAHEEINQEKAMLCDGFGKWLATNQIPIITGACGGIPYIVGKTVMMTSTINIPIRNGVTPRKIVEIGVPFLATPAMT